MPKNINIVYCGLGFEGQKALSKLSKLITKLKKKNINLNLLGLIDISKDTIDLSQKNLEAQNFSFKNNNEIYYSDLKEFFEKIKIKEEKDKNEKEPILIYDATPSNIHKDNLAIIHEYLYYFKNRIYYFGEKPLLIDKDELKLLKESQIHIWVNFIELYSDVFLNLCEFLKNPKSYENNNSIEFPKELKVKKIESYRLSNIACQKLFLNKRGGIMGGSLEDKMVHDLSLSFGILYNIFNYIFDSSNKSNSSNEFKINKAEILTFMPYDDSSIEYEKPIFATCWPQKDESKISSTEIIGHNKWLWPNKITETTSDASFFAEIDWKFKLKKNIQNIGIKYISSWIGLLDAPEVKRIIENINENFIYRKMFSIDPLRLFFEEEARIWYIECEGEFESENKKKKNGKIEEKKHSIYCNFLKRERNDYSPDIEPKIIFYPDKGPKCTLSLQNKDDSIERIFEAVILDCCNIHYNNQKPQQLLIYKNNAYEIHSLIYALKEKAFEIIYDRHIEIIKATKKFKNHFYYKCI